MKRKIEVELPEEFIREIDQFIESAGFGYADRNEFIRESIRVHYRKMKE